MKTRALLPAGLMSLALCAGAARAADGAAIPSAPSHEAKLAERDFGKLSMEGVSAFDDIHLARLAIFEGKIEEAAQFISDAQGSLAKAKTDETAFMKAEAAFHPPVPSTAASARNNIAVVWIPIDAEIAVGESFRATPEKSAAMVSARKTLAKGDGAHALNHIKLAAIDVNYTLAVAPLLEVSGDVDAAQQQFAAKDYYGASQSLRKAEAAVRYDQVTDIADVKNITAAK